MSKNSEPIIPEQRFDAVLLKCQQAGVQRPRHIRLSTVVQLDRLDNVIGHESVAEHYMMNVVLSYTASNTES